MMYNGEVDDDCYEVDYDEEGTPASPECIDLVTDSEEEKEKGEDDEVAYVQPEAVYQQRVSKGAKLHRSNPNQNKRLYQRNRLFISLIFDCTECDRTDFPSENLYKKHLRDDHFTYNHRCYLPHCLQSFKRNIFLRQHLSKWHPTEVDWHCSLCGKAHNNHEELKKHFELSHQLGTFVCNFKGGCKFETINREQMLLHFRESHCLTKFPDGKFAAKNYICNFEGCQEAFATNALVRRHQLFHLKIKPYSCSLCDYMSEVRYATIVHIRTVHFGLPAYKHDQRAQNIVDDRDPAMYLRVAVDKLNQIKDCAKNIKRVK